MDQIDLTVIGPKTATQVAVFCHGFGVGRDSRGLFPALATVLAEVGWRSHLFDLSDYPRPGKIVGLPLSEQVKRTAAVIDCLDLDGSPLVLIGHSFGCLVVASYMADAKAVSPAGVVLLAPAVNLRRQRRQDQKRSDHPDGAVSLYGQKGTETVLSAKYIRELRLEPESVYGRLLSRSGDRTLVVWAEDDIKSAGPPAWMKSAEMVTIAGADHNFNRHQDPLGEKVVLFLADKAR